MVVTRAPVALPPGALAPPFRYWLETYASLEPNLILVQLAVALTAVTVCPR